MYKHKNSSNILNMSMEVISSLYRGPNAAKVFVESIRKEVNEITTIYGKIKDMLRQTTIEIKEYNAANKCILCKCIFTHENPKVHHYDHHSGKYIAPICYTCDLKLKTPNILPVFYHHLSGYRIPHIR